MILAMGTTRAFAAEVAGRFNTDHTASNFTSHKAEQIERLVRHYHQPSRIRVRWLPCALSELTRLSHVR